MESGKAENKAPQATGDEPLTPAVARNIEMLAEWRRRSRAEASLENRIAAVISRFAGSMACIYLHLLIFGAWIAINIGWVPFVRPWDASLVILAMVASVEAIFLSTFVLINQNRMAAEEDERAELDLQISLLNEHETTRLIELIEAIGNHLGVKLRIDEEVGELKKEIRPDALLDELANKKQADKSTK